MTEKKTFTLADIAADPRLDGFRTELTPFDADDLWRMQHSPVGIVFPKPCRERSGGKLGKIGYWKIEDRETVISWIVDHALAYQAHRRKQQEQPAQAAAASERSELEALTDSAPQRVGDPVQPQQKQPAAAPEKTQKEKDAAAARAAWNREIGRHCKDLELVLPDVSAPWLELANELIGIRVSGIWARPMTYKGEHIYCKSFTQYVNKCAKISKTAVATYWNALSAEEIFSAYCGWKREKKEKYNAIPVAGAQAYIYARKIQRHNIRTGKSTDRDEDYKLIDGLQTGRLVWHRHRIEEKESIKEKK